MNVARLVDTVRGHQACQRNVAWLVCALVATSCGGDMSSPGNHGPYPLTSVPAPVNGVAQFTVLPIAIAPGLTLTALGNLAPPGHVLPTDHVYFYDWDLSSRSPGTATDVRTVYMPTTGAVIWTLPQSFGESKVTFRATNDFYFYFDHIVLSTPLTVGQVVPAGAQIGATRPGVTLDLGAFDMSVSHNGFVSDSRYAVQTQYAVSPWKYFTPELQAQIYPHVYRAPTAADKDGKIDFGVAGTLSGDWFLQGMPVDSSSAPYGWTRTLSFAYDYYDPSQVRISIGGTVASAGVWGIAPSAPVPSTVTAAAGIVAYQLYSPFDPGFPPYGRMLVQVVDASTIKVEVFVGSQASATQFDANAFTFVR